MRILAVLIAAGALVACVPKGDGPSAPGAAVVAPDETPAATEAIPERCQAWIEWTVDGNGMPPHPMAPLRVPFVALDQMARACLGRPGNPYHQPDVPDLVPIMPAPEAEPKPEPTTHDGEKIAI